MTDLKCYYCKKYGTYIYFFPDFNYDTFNKKTFTNKLNFYFLQNKNK